MATWLVIRLVEEKFEVEAATPEEAKANAEDPFSVRVVQETVRERHQP